MSGDVRPVTYGIALSALLIGFAIVTGHFSYPASTVLLTTLGLASITAAVIGLIRASARPPVASTPVPERRIESKTPKTTPSDAYREFGGTATRKNATWLGIRRIAFETLARYTSDDDPAAKRQLDEGTWTDDEDVARYVATGSAADGRVLDRLQSNRRTNRIIRKSVREIAAIQSPTDTVPDGTTDTDPTAGTETEVESSEERGTRTTSRNPERPVSLARVETGHWWGLGAIALGAIGTGALLESPGLLLAGTAAIGYAGVARSTAVSEPRLRVDRSIDTQQPEPGETVTVETTITNVGERSLFDVKIIDGVPGALQVSDGTCRVGTPLRAGQSVTVEYAFEARPGTHEFDPAMVIVGDVSRSGERTILVPESTTISCTPRLRSTASAVPLQLSVIRRTGHLTTAEGGSGTDFHSIREYQDGDPINRIDWNRRARTGELATIQFHTERATRVLLVVDARQEAYVAPKRTAMHAVDRSVDAAGSVAVRLLEDGDSVGLAAIGPPTRSNVDEVSTQQVLTDTCWIPPAAGPEHRLEIQNALTGHPQFSTVPAPESNMWISQVGQLRRQLTGETQVILFTPLSDFGGPIIARRFAARGHPVTVVSPDPTTTDSTETELARICRTLRRDSLHRNGIPVLDWPSDEPIEALLQRYARREVVR